MYNISIIIPCYNETGNLAKIKQELMPVVEELGRTWSVEVIFIDDGSSDSTGRMFEMAFRGWAFPTAQQDIKIKILRHRRNRGLGAALRTGFRSSQGEVILTLDSDGTYSFSTIPEMLSCLKPGIDIVTASPYHPEGGVEGVPAWRLLFSKGASMLYRLIVDRSIHTYTSLYRVYRRWIIEGFDFRSDGFLAGTELLVRAVLDGARVEEFPTVLHRRIFGVSKARVVRVTISHLRFLGRVLMHRLRLRPFHALASQVHLR